MITSIIRALGFSLLLCLAAGAAVAGSPAIAPQIVLDGTDLVELTAFETVPVPDELAGSFGTETGGAEQTLEVTPVGPETWRIERRISEPGAAPMAQRYEVRRVDGVLRDAGHTVELRATAHGVLMLETAAGEAVPGSYWTLYPAR